MDTGHGFIALVALFVVLKGYIWCQFNYWNSPECAEDTKPEEARTACRHHVKKRKG